MSPRRRLLLAVISTVVVALGAVLAVRLITRDSRDVPPQDRPGAVVLVPGYGGNVGSLEQLAERIRATGRVATVVSLPDGGTGDLAAQARVLDAAVGKADSVDVIGYSAGGVVARLWAQEHDGTHKARRIITLGAPHHGARIAAAGAAALPGACPLACQQLSPGSRLLAGLDVPVPRPPVWLSVWTENDQTVTPPDSARLEGALNVSLQSLCPGLHASHSELPSNAVVTALVLNAIGPGTLTQPASCPG